MAMKLHRCSTMWVKVGAHPCWKVQQALDKADIDYELVKHPSFPRGRRRDYIELTGQSVLPAIELEDGTLIREDSNELARRIEAGELST